MKPAPFLAASRRTAMHEKQPAIRQYASKHKGLASIQTIAANIGIDIAIPMAATRLLTTKGPK